jgi:chloride channel 7
VPGGLFVPSIVVGGCMGRVVGYVVHTYISAAVNPGVYALLGAASMFGGFTRLALPAVIMLIEMTGDATYLLPIMFCTVLAKVVSDEIVPPLYPQHMAIEGIPTLGDKLNPLIAPLSAKHIMNRSFYSVHQVDTLTHILDVLDKSRSMLLPVTTTDGKFVGMIMRRSVIYALRYSTKYQTEGEIEAGGQGDSEGPNTSSVSAVEKKMGGWDDTTDYAKSIEKFDDKYAHALINLTPFMDAGQSRVTRTYAVAGCILSVFCHAHRC